MKMIKAARTSMGMSQSAFAKWLADQTGKETPYPIPNISNWENGKRMPNEPIRKVCWPIAAAYATRLAKKRPLREAIAIIEGLI